MGGQALTKAEDADEDVSDRHTRFRILKVEGRKRAFSLEPVFWSILEEAARAASMRLGDYVGALIADAPPGNNSSLLRSKAAEWSATQAERLRDKGLVPLARRIAVSHATPAFVIDQHRRVIAHNKAFEDLTGTGMTRGSPVRFGGPEIRLGVPMGELARVLRLHPDKFLRANFAARSGELERNGALNIMLVGEERENVLYLCLVKSIDEARRCA